MGGKVYNNLVRKGLLNKEIERHRDTTKKTVFIGDSRMECEAWIKNQSEKNPLPEGKHYGHYTNKQGKHTVLIKNCKTQAFKVQNIIKTVSKASLDAMQSLYRLPAHTEVDDRKLQYAINQNILNQVIPTQNSPSIDINEFEQSYRIRTGNTSRKWHIESATEWDQSSSMSFSD